MEPYITMTKATLGGVIGGVLILILAGPQLFHAQNTLNEQTNKALDQITNTIPNKNAQQSLSEIRQANDVVETAKDVRQTSWELYALLGGGVSIIGIIAFFLNRTGFFNFSIR